MSQRVEAAPGLQQETLRVSGQKGLRTLLIERERAERERESGAVGAPHHHPTGREPERDGTR